MILKTSVHSPLPRYTMPYSLPKAVLISTVKHTSLPINFFRRNSLAWKAHGCNWDRNITVDSHSKANQKWIPNNKGAYWLIGISRSTHLVANIWLQKQFLIFQKMCIMSNKNNSLITVGFLNAEYSLLLIYRPHTLYYFIFKHPHSLPNW